MQSYTKYKVLRKHESVLSLRSIKALSTASTAIGLDSLLMDCGRYFWGWDYLIINTSITILHPADDAENNTIRYQHTFGNEPRINDLMNRRTPASSPSFGRGSQAPAVTFTLRVLSIHCTSTECSVLHDAECR